MTTNQTTVERGNNMKKFKVSEWRKMTVVHNPTGRDPMIKLDSAGTLWAWQSGGKYVHAKKWFYRNDIHRIMATL